MSKERVRSFQKKGPELVKKNTDQDRGIVQFLQNEWSRFDERMGPDQAKFKVKRKVKTMVQIR